MRDPVILDSQKEILPFENVTVSWTADFPCQMLGIKPNPELSCWNILDIRVGHHSQLVAKASIPGDVFSGEGALLETDVCNVGLSIELEVQNASDVPRRFAFELILRDFTGRTRSPIDILNE